MSDVQQFDFLVRLSPDKTSDLNQKAKSTQRYAITEIREGISGIPWHNRLFKQIYSLTSEACEPLRKLT